jgi:CubicO group peptidase (beta-lactamase class C family)
MKSPLFYLLPVLFVLTFKAYTQTGIAVGQMQGCDNQIEAFMTKWNLPGATFALAKNGKLMYMRGFGYHDLAQTDSVQPYHLFRVASVSKPITAIAIMKLVEGAQLSLDDTIFGAGGILENHPYLSTAIISDSRVYHITVRHLLEHTAGWDRNVPCVAGNATPYTYSPSHCDPIAFPLHVTQTLGEPNPVTEEMHIKFLMEKGLNHTPGSTYAYSNIGYLILGEVIEEISGLSYEDFVKTAILQPIGACDMHVGKSLLAEKLEREVQYTGNGYTSLNAYSGSGNVPWEYGGWILEAMSAHGGWVSTARDLVRLVLAVDGFTSPTDILNSTSINTMTTPGSNNQNYALGWSVNSFNNWWHTGSLDGTASVIVRSAGGYVWALLLNKRAVTNTNAFWSELDNLPWNCVSSTNSWPSHDLGAIPNISATAVNASQAGADVTLSWINGNGNKRMVVLSTDSVGDVYPLDGKNYTANNTYGLGDDLGGGNYVVYNGNASSVSVSGLAAGQRYYARIYEYNQSAITGQYALYNLCGRAEVDFVNGRIGVGEFSLISSVHPNPAADVVRIVFSENVSGQVSLFSASGNLVLEEVVQDQKEVRLNISRLPKGFYTIAIKTMAGQSNYKVLKL